MEKEVPHTFMQREQKDHLGWTGNKKLELNDVNDKTHTYILSYTNTYKNPVLSYIYNI